MTKEKVITHLNHNQAFVNDLDQVINKAWLYVHGIVSVNILYDPAEPKLEVRMK